MIDNKVTYDLFIVGGGINGSSIARDAAGRGLKVALAEQSDLASATSSASTKLIHGGLRYLEQYEFRLVRESLKEREVLMELAPHIIWPLRFTLPHDRHQRPAWLIRLGLFLYDHMGGRKKLPGTKATDLRQGDIGAPLKDQFTRGFTYSDCWVQDARLTVLNAMDARHHGAEIQTQMRFLSGERKGNLWLCRIQDLATRDVKTVYARGLVNAAGPWVASLLQDRLRDDRGKAIRMIKGSHIVVKRKYTGDHCYIFQNPDGRIFFSIPYENDFTLIGTTDEDYNGDPSSVEISHEEINYICQSASAYFKQPIERSDIVWSYSGIRPLYDDQSQEASTITRDYVFDITDDNGNAPLLSIFGGKITTARKLAEHAMEELACYFSYERNAWTNNQTLPGGDFGGDDLQTFILCQQAIYSGFPPHYIERLVKHYGTCIDTILGHHQTFQDLGQHFGADLYEAEVAYLMAEEWAKSAEDIVWRRTKLGLHMKDSEITLLDQWMGALSDQHHQLAS